MARLEQVKRSEPIEVPAANPYPGAALEGQALTKRYGGRAVVNNVEVHVGKGEIVGMLGPNGAGKTTTFYMLVGLLRPDEGKITLGGEDITHAPALSSGPAAASVTCRRSRRFSVSSPSSRTSSL